MSYANPTFAARAAAGLCVRCGLVPPRPNRTRCFSCAKGDAADQEPYTAARAPRRRELYRAQRPADARQYVCGQCGQRGHNRRSCPTSRAA